MSFLKKNLPLALAIVSFVFYFLGFCTLLDSSTVTDHSIAQIGFGLTASILSIIFYWKRNMDEKKILLSLSFLTASLICGSVSGITYLNFETAGNILIFLIPLILLAISLANKKMKPAVGIGFIVLCILCTYLSITASAPIYASAAALYIAFSMKLFDYKEESSNEKV